MGRNEMDMIWRERFTKLAGDPFREGVTHRIIGEMVAFKTLVPMQPVAIIRVETLVTHEIKGPDDWSPCHENLPEGAEECAVCRTILPKGGSHDVEIEELPRVSETIWKRLADLSRDAEQGVIRAGSRMRVQLAQAWALKIAEEWVRKETGAYDSFTGPGASARFQSEIDRTSSLIFQGDDVAAHINLPLAIAMAARGLVLDASTTPEQEASRP